ncbi:MAG: hypothetical protein ABR596_09710 [Halarsenatibacteraceae bacterium]
MWQIVYVANDKAEADKIEDKLLANGFMIEVEKLSDDSYQIKSLASEAEEVYEFLNENF